MILHLMQILTPQALYADCRDYCLARRAAGSKNRLLISTILPRGNLGATITVADLETKRSAYNQLVRNDHTFADGLCDYATDPEMGQAGQQESTVYYVDKIHPTTAGYTRLAAINAAALEPLLDVVNPTRISSVVGTDGKVTVTLSESVNGNSGLSFRVGGVNRTFSIAGSGATRVLTPTPLIYVGETVLDSYTPGNVADAAGNPLAAYTDQLVTNNSAVPVPDTTRPALLSASINAAGNVLTLIYSEPVLNVSAADYSLAGHTLSSVIGTGSARSMTISPVAYQGVAKSLSGGAATSDANGNLMLALAGAVVTNGSTVPVPDTTAPAVPALNVPVASEGQVLLSWASNTDDTVSYELYRDGISIYIGPLLAYLDMGSQIMSPTPIDC
jgi:hypothetical protein